MVALLDPVSHKPHSTVAFYSSLRWAVDGRGAQNARLMDWFVRGCPATSPASCGKLDRRMEWRGASVVEARGG